MMMPAPLPAALLTLWLVAVGLQPHQAAAAAAPAAAWGGQQVFRGSYSCGIKTTASEALPLRNESAWSEDDFDATVRTLLATGQNLYGYRVEECKFLEALPALLRTVDALDPGGELRIFAWLSSHAGHGSGLYCPEYVDAAGDVSWTLVASALAKVSLSHPRLIGFNIDDFFVTMAQPCGDAEACGQANLPSGKPLHKSDIAAAYSAMKKVNPKFKFWPSIYFQQLGLAYNGGFVFGATAMVPFDNQTSASLRLGYSGPAIPSARLSFRYTSMYPPPANEGNEWAGRVFMSVTACGKEVLRADMFAPGASSGGDLGASGESSFEGNISLACGGAAAGGAGVEFKLFSPNPLNDNFYAHKIANVFLLSLTGPDGRELIGTTLVTEAVSTQPSPNSCQAHRVCNFTNQGRMIARPSDDWAIGEFTDGAMMPFSHRPLDFAASSYTRLMADARRLVGPRPKTLVVAHYARNGLLNNRPFDPATLREELEIDLRGGSADGAAVWSMPLAIAGAPDRAGIFSEKKLLPPPPTHHHGALPSANITAPLLTYFPSGQTGYFGWFQRYVSRGVLPLDADAATQPGQLVKLAMKHSNQKPYAGSTPLFTKAVYLRSDASQRLPAAVLYFGAAEGRACSTAGDFPCPGSSINTSDPQVGNASCVLRCNASEAGLETLLLTLPQPGHLVLEMNEVLGVGNYHSDVQWTVPQAQSQWKFESGVADAGTVLMYNAVVSAYTK